MRTLGIIFVFLGLVLLLKQFNPAFIAWLQPYAGAIKGAFWGVTLVAFGLYMLTKRTARRVVLVLYLIYLLLYLVV
ncbi:hypothetical protein E3E26_00485 [Thermococcus sp. LS1]|uniref:hypothetical protein n=1 Tax=Thermococcus sp. LS1 TaxID=1638259 RepID=UPI0014393881|nr:hypothetical protein [Thermococcus sp. LS1]NJD98285.1 hypothetical protein [Thermococcus sp. LS1]